MRIKMTIAGLSLLAAIALACGSSPSVSEVESGATEAPAGEAKPAQPKAVQVGQKLSVKTDTLTATYTLSKAKVHTRGEYGSTPENGAWLVAFLRVDVARGETFACSCELSLVQKDGKVREQTYASISGKPEFESAELKAGQYADGWVMFDLPQSQVNSSKVQLKIASLFADSAYGYWTIKV
jgi:hypothetical protein